MTVEILAATDVAPESLHAAFGLAFADYLIGPLNVSFENFPLLLGRQGVDLSLSRAFVRDGELLAFCLVAPRPQSRPPRWRLATMGAVPAARGSGAAPALLDDLFLRASKAGIGEVELEVFAQNERALKLYRGRGFEPLHELHGYTAAPLGAESLAPLAPQAPVRQVSREAALQWISHEAMPELDDLPLQVTPTSLQANPAALQAWQCGSAQLVFSQPDAQSIAVASLIDLDPAQTDARTLAQQLRAAHPGCTIRVPQLQRRDIGGQALRDEGFALEPLHQLLMRARLT